MATAEGGLSFALDENLGSIPSLLRQARAISHEQVFSLPDLGLSRGSLDLEIFEQLERRSRHVLVTRDGSMLDPVIQRGRWQRSGVILFLLDKRWGLLPLGELTRRLLFLWPSLVAQAEASAAGTAWRVRSTVPPAATNTFRLVSGQHMRS